MTPAMLLTVALFVAGIGGSVLAYWIRRNDTTTAAVGAKVEALGEKIDKVHQTVFGPTGDNGLYGDTRAVKAHVHRANGFMAGVSLFLNLECDDKGAVRFLEGESLLERRLADRRVGHGRRASDA